jgi:hypothetical protein
MPLTNWAGSGGAGTFPTGYTVLGANSSACSLSQGVVNGVSTGIVSLRRVGTGIEGLVPSANNPVYATNASLTASVYIRVPAGVTPNDVAYYDGNGGNGVIIATQAQLLAQTPGTWVAYSKPFVSSGTPTGTNAGGFGLFNNNGVGSGCDLAFPQLQTANTSGYLANTTSSPVYGPRFDYDPNNIIQQNLWAYNAAPQAGYTTSAATVVPNATQAPDGTTTAWKLIEDTSLSSHSYITSSVPWATGRPYTVSYYVKAAGRTNFIIAGLGSNGQGYTFAVDLVTGNSALAPPGATMTNVGNGWWYFQWTLTTSSFAQFQIIMEDTFNAVTTTYQGDGVSGLYLWGFQLSNTSSVRPFLSVSATPRTICTPKGLLVEEARTNLLFPSQTVSSWTLNGTASVVDKYGQSLSPNGSYDASYITATVGNSGYWKGFTTTASTVYTCSVYVKYGVATTPPGLTTILLGTDQNPTSAKFNFDLLTGAFSNIGGTITAYGATDVGNGWWRVYWTYTSTGVTGDILAYSNTTATNQTWWLWGAQAEAGAFPTSYIPTTSATVARNFDNLSIASSVNFSSWFVQATGTFFVQYDTGSFSNTPSAFSVNPSGGFNAGSTGVAQWYNGTTNIFTANSSTAVNTSRKEAFAYTASSRALCLNGGTVATDANVPFSGSLTGMFWGNAYGTGSQNINGHIQSFQYYNYTLTNAQLQIITT